jgi:hypothetical protein
MKTVDIALGARSLAERVTGMTVEVVSRCERVDGGWRVLVEVLETRARIGDNDVLATYRLDLDASGDLTGYERTARYVRGRSIGAA